ncbi:hypothetical protein ACSBR1_008313 [Camellia fascicularis]
MGSRLQWNFIATALLGILFLLDSCFSENAPYPTFARDATVAPAEIFYDYIIIGGGTAGCALAATLSQGANVLVLERGGLPYGNPTINNMGSFADTLANISPSSPSQSFISTDGVNNARARVLGGGTCLNAGFYTRASTAYVRRVGWDQKLVNESYEWVENKLVFRPPMLEWQSAVRDGLLEVGMMPDNGFTYDHIYGTKVGGTIFDQDGHRHTAANLLEYADPAKITVYLNAVVHQIFFRTTAGQAKPKAEGVAFRDANGKMHRAYLNKGSSMNEIILSAGALGSPQLLMLSGIGPKQHLMAHGIKVLMDHPMVGQGMADNPMNAVFIPTLTRLDVSLIQVVGIPQSDSYYIETASGALFGAALAQMFANQIRHNSTALANRIFNSFLNPASHIGILLEKIAGPFSTGHLELQTLDPNDNPRVTFNYFKDPKDLQRCVEGMKTITQIIESSALSKFNSLPAENLIGLMLTLPVNLRPRHLRAALSLEQFCIDTVMTIWHYHGGCQVGRVVDSEYKVLGVDALRVVDGSTLYDSPGTNPQATVMMLGRYMGQRILHERFPNGKK